MFPYVKNLISRESVEKETFVGDKKPLDSKVSKSIGDLPGMVLNL
jgi:hypothetical protein